MAIRFRRKPMNWKEFDISGRNRQISENFVRRLPLSPPPLQNHRIPSQSLIVLKKSATFHFRVPLDERVRSVVCVCGTAARVVPQFAESNGSQRIAGTARARGNRWLPSDGLVYGRGFGG